MYVMFRHAKRRVVMVRLNTLSSWLPKHKKHGFARRYARESCYGFRVTSEVTSSIAFTRTGAKNSSQDTFSVSHSGLYCDFTPNKQLRLICNFNRSLVLCEIGPGLSFIRLLKHKKQLNTTKYYLPE